MYVTIATDEVGVQTQTITSTTGDTIGMYQRSAPAADGSTVARFLNGASFDGAGRMIQVKDTDGATWWYGYDMLGNRLSATDPDIGTWYYAYDNANRLTSQLDARGARITISYDSIGRILQKKAYNVNIAGDTGILLAQNSYDEQRVGVYNLGQLTTAQSATMVQKFNYNADGLEVQKFHAVDTIAHDDSTVYDQGKRPIYKTYNDRPSLTIGSSSSHWTYDRKGQLLTIPGYITATTYMPDGQTASITYANGVKTIFSYSPERGWLTGIVTQNSAGTRLLGANYSRDAAGRITAIDEDGTANDWTYTYDRFGRVATAIRANNPAYSETFSYADNDNLISRSRLAGSFAYPPAGSARPHAPTSLNGVAFSYDANGNMINDGSRQLIYDLANRVASVTANGSTTNFAYGPDGARSKKTGSNGTTLYYSADVEFDMAANTFTRYPHMDIKLVGNNVYFLHRDHLSSVRFVTNMAGEIVESTDYAAYGETTNKAMTTQKSYIGERFDPETGLMYLNARYMDPRFGKYVPADDGAVIEPSAKSEEERHAQ